MATLKTKQQMATATARRLGVIAARQTLSSADADYIEGEYDDLLEELRDKGLAYWPNTTRTTSEIPAEVFGALVLIMAGRISGPFGMPDPVVTDDDGKSMAATAKGWRDLRRHLAKGPSGEPTTAVYY